MPRVARIQSRICVGGPSLHSIILSEGLSTKRGSAYDTTLISGALEPGERSMEPAAKARGIDVEIIPEMRRPVRPALDLRAVQRMVKTLRRLRPEIVHTHTAKAGAVGRMAARLARVPILVHTFHGHVFDGYFSARTVKSFVRVERTLARLSDCILAISETQRRELVDKYRIAPAKKVRVIPLGLELERFREVRHESNGFLRRTLGLRAGQPMVLAVGRLAPIKRYDLLIEAFGRVLSAVPDAHLVIAGGGDSEERQRLENLAKANEDRIHFLGWCQNLERFYSEADVYVLSSDNEGTPVAVIEALSAGVPVVATRVGGVEDIVGDDMGHLVPRGDVRELSLAIDNILNTGGGVPAFLRDQVVRKFSHRRLLSDIEALYDELMDAKSTSPLLTSHFGKHAGASSC